jgi:hypothetical protein
MTQLETQMALAAALIAGCTVAAQDEHSSLAAQGEQGLADQFPMSGAPPQAARITLTTSAQKANPNRRLRSE